MVNPFSGDGFTMASLMRSIDKLPYVPGRIAALGLFSNEGVNVPTVLIEERDQQLVLVANTRRGAPSQTQPGEQRKMRSFVTTHLPLEDYVTTDDLLGMREFGSETAQESLSAKVNKKLAKMKQSLSATLEWMRLGCLKGIVLDGSGNTVYNYFNEFGIPTPTAFDFTLGTTTTDIRGKCSDVNEAISVALNGRPMDHVHAFCGSTFFKRLMGHADVKDMLKWANPTMNTVDPLARGSFTYGDIIWEPYRGQINGTPYVPQNGCIFFPVGSPDVFTTFYGPSTWLETAGQNGVPIYAKQIPTDENTGTRVLVQSNPLPLCLLPAVLRTGTTSN